MYNTAIELINKINNNGFVSYIVGGFPRDLYIKRASNDVDICTNATPKDLKQIFGNAMLPKVNYGSVTVIYKKIRFEITTFRKESKYLNNRVPAKVEYIDSLIDDLKRRDFTINTLCIDSNGTMIDMLDGVKDIEAHVIKMVGSPKIRLKEDALRILRAIRFATELNFEIDGELKKYIKKYGNLLTKLSYYRKKEELDKIFSSPNVSYGISLIKELGLDKPLELKNINNLVVCDYQIGIWAQLDVLNTYKFSNNEADMIKKINKLSSGELDVDSLYKYGLFISTIVGSIKKIPKKDITCAYNALPIKSMTDIKIEALDIAKILNKTPGPYIKDIMLDLEYQILHSKLINEYDEISKYIIDKYKNI